MGRTRDYLAANGRGSHLNPSTGASTVNHANSASPTSATLANATAGYATLGGRWQFAAVGGAATDYALFGFQVPSGSKLYVTGIAISTVNTGAAVATSATILDWSVSANSTSVDLGAGAPRRVTVGTQALLSGAAIGAMANDVVRGFDPPLYVASGNFFHVILQMPVGTATASQVLRGDVQVNGWFE